MNKTLWLALAVLLTLACGAALGVGSPAAPATPSPALAAILAGPTAGAQFVAINHCEPPTRFVCVNKQCQCAEITCAGRGVKSFSCDPATGISSCVCN